jgi:hydrogenase maturation protease
MKRALVIGYGNPLRRDDGVGVVAARDLAEGGDPRIEVMAQHQLTPELAEPISRAGRVVFIDAACAGRPGSWRCARVKPQTAPAQGFTHHFTPGVLLACAEALYTARPEAFLVSIAAESLEAGEGLSPRVRAALPAVLQRVRQLTSQPQDSSSPH